MPAVLDPSLCLRGAPGCAGLCQAVPVCRISRREPGCSPREGNSCGHGRSLRDVAGARLCHYDAARCRRNTVYINKLTVKLVRSFGHHCKTYSRRYIKNEDLL